MADPEIPGAAGRRGHTDPEREIAMSAAVAPQPFGTGELAPAVVSVLSPRVRRVIAPNPTLMTGPGTGSYLVGDPSGELAVVDPGPDLPGHLDRLAEVGAGRIRWIVVTHTHLDHSPGVPGLVARTGAATVGFRADEDWTPDVLAGDGWTLRLEGQTVATTLRALHTPGHASNHLCWLVEEENLLFSGDHIMDGSTVVIAPPDGDMAAYLAQLERLRGLGLSAIAPGHGRLITDPDARIDAYLKHRRDRETQLVGALAELTAGGATATVEELVARCYTETPEALRPVARYSVWAHLRKLAGEGRVAADDPDEVATAWRLTA